MPMQMAGMPQMQQPQMQQQMMGMPQMHQPQMQQPQTQQPSVAVQQETQGVYSSISGWWPGMETKVTTAGWPLFELPKVRLTEGHRARGVRAGCDLVGGPLNAVLYHHLLGADAPTARYAHSGRAVMAVHRDLQALAQGGGAPHGNVWSYVEGERPVHQR